MFSLAQGSHILWCNRATLLELRRWEEGRRRMAIITEKQIHHLIDHLLPRPEAHAKRKLISEAKAEGWPGTRSSQRKMLRQRFHASFVSWSYLLITVLELLIRMESMYQNLTFKTDNSGLTYDSSMKCNIYRTIYAIWGTETV